MNEEDSKILKQILEEIKALREDIKELLTEEEEEEDEEDEQDEEIEEPDDSIFNKQKAH